ncbi:unnamed protein product [Euphydryas editha]|uniref:Uncharacterized protein n=1 Tax=Euphydryas editha TaxID=104508 RepID=A0AAU9TNH2_EUPED|nr:unnamed protein product [Euphydryas editha]
MFGIRTPPKQNEGSNPSSKTPPKLEANKLVRKHLEKWEAATSGPSTFKVQEILALPWWSEELTALKREVATKKGRIRCAAPVRRQMVVEQYLEAKARYNAKIKEAQSSHESLQEGGSLSPSDDTSS